MRDSEDWTGKLLTPKEQRDWLDKWNGIGGPYFFLGVLVVSAPVLFYFIYLWIFHA